MASQEIPLVTSVTDQILKTLEKIQKTRKASSPAGFGELSRKGLLRLRSGGGEEAVVDFEHQDREAGPVMLPENVGSFEGSETGRFERAVRELIVEDLITELFVVALPGISAEVDHALGGVVVAVEIRVRGIPPEFGIFIDELTGATSFLG